MGAYIVSGIFILFDIISGLLKALHNGDINSTKLRQGLYNKAAEVMAIVGAGLLEIGTAYVNLGVSIPALGAVTVYICLTEFISILENLSAVNPALAKLFSPYLDKLKEGEIKNDKKGN